MLTYYSSLRLDLLWIVRSAFVRGGWLEPECSRLGSILKAWHGA